MQRWCVAACLPAKEKIAAANLANQAFGHFLPLRRKSLRVSNRIHTRLVPLFPGYIFVQMDDQAANWRAVNGTIGVKYLISSDETPVALPRGFVEAMIEFGDDRGLVSFRPLVKIGDRVEFASGPFSNRMGKVLALDDKGRVAVLMEMLAIDVPVKTRIENLLPA